MRPDDDSARPDGRGDWRSLSVLRDRVEAAVREIGRLRSENAALAKRLIELEGARDDAPSFTFGDGEDPADLRERVEGFIEMVDGLLAAVPETDDADEEAAA